MLSTNNLVLEYLGHHVQIASPEVWENSCDIYFFALYSKIAVDTEKL
jgi:hypothetical protein